MTYFCNFSIIMLPDDLSVFNMYGADKIAFKLFLDD